MEAPVKAARTAKRRQLWTREHRGDVIHCHVPDGQLSGEWWECCRDGDQIAEANDPGMLLDILERNFA